MTSSLAQNGGKGYEAGVGNYTTSDSDAEVATVGPALSITRDYNSLDTRADSAFGRGWSSLLDMRAREDRDAAGVLQTATIRYPDGQDVSFGRNNDGTWVPPSGRFSVFKAITGGYSLTDKDATGYEFTQSPGGGAFHLTKVTDASGRALTLRYDTNGRVDQLRSVTSNRTLTIGWSTPAGAAHPHVATVTTDPVTPGAPGTALTWSYEYDTDLLERVCPPGTSTECASLSIFKNSIIDAIREITGWHDDEVASYLDSGIPLIDIMESTTDVIGGDARISGGSSILTDGTWVWRQDLSFHVKNYHLELDGDCVEHAMKMNFAIPEPDHSSLLALADIVLREVLGMG
ncbi:DUF6531 domain-containing protein [Micromonospora sp. ATCC 39149]|uniref:DUF6531 domain-containing protein n=1 Tax=Micromonospora carbonacea TaxID=47853 RepID=A0A7D5Y6Q9_9ACTN|nr:DUF6531 domain-containing protein [Micromonospora sp. ATCC 39149]QLJ96959.1 hypothetical protein HZU44_18985 [Micromonospora carbonacea]